jgi:cell division protein FtsB
MQTYDPNKNTRQVRQGSDRKMNMRVLTISTLVVVLAFALIYIWFFVVGSN